MYTHSLPEVSVSNIHHEGGYAVHCAQVQHHPRHSLQKAISRVTSKSSQRTVYKVHQYHW
jgi:hypothetical protein